MTGYKKQGFALHIGGWVYIPKEASQFEIIPLSQGGPTLTWMVPIDVDYIPYLADAPAFTQADLDAAVRAERNACANIAEDHADGVRYLNRIGDIHPMKAEAGEAMARGIAAAIRERKP